MSCLFQPLAESERRDVRQLTPARLVPRFRHHATAFTGRDHRARLRTAMGSRVSVRLAHWNDACDVDDDEVLRHSQGR